MDVEQCFLRDEKSTSATVAECESISGYFDCSICLDFARDPVVTLCGHLYCWPCIYKWLHFQRPSLSPEDCTQCPVCKVQISQKSLVPLYVHDRTVSEAQPKANSMSKDIPPRPTTAPATRDVENISPSYGQQIAYHNSNENVQNFRDDLGSPTAAILCHSMMGRFGEMVYARLFENSESLYVYPNTYYEVGRSNPRREDMQAHKSLNRLSFFFFCCLIVCLLLF